MRGSLTKDVLVSRLIACGIRRLGWLARLLLE